MPAAGFVRHPIRVRDSPWSPSSGCAVDQARKQRFIGVGPREEFAELSEYVTGKGRFDRNSPVCVHTFERLGMAETDGHPRPTRESDVAVFLRPDG